MSDPVSEQFADDISDLLGRAVGLAAIVPAATPEQAVAFAGRLQHKARRAMERVRGNRGKDAVLTFDDARLCLAVGLRIVARFLENHPYAPRSDAGEKG